MVAVQDHERRARGERLHLVAPVVQVDRKPLRAAAGISACGHGAQVLHTSKECYTDNIMTAGECSTPDRSVHVHGKAMSSPQERKTAHSMHHDVLQARQTASR